jgi:hypothetical protein
VDGIRGSGGVSRGLKVISGVAVRGTPGMLVGDDGYVAGANGRGIIDKDTYNNPAAFLCSIHKNGDKKQQTVSNPG